MDGAGSVLVDSLDGIIYFEVDDDTLGLILSRS